MHIETPLPREKLVVNVNLKGQISPSQFKVNKAYMKQIIQSLFIDEALTFVEINKTKQLPRMTAIVKRKNSQYIDSFLQKKFIEVVREEYSSENSSNSMQQKIRLDFIINFFQFPDTSSEFDAHFFDDGFFQKNFNEIEYKIKESSTGKKTNAGQYGNVKMCLSKQDNQYYAIKVLNNPIKINSYKDIISCRQYRQIKTLIRLYHQNIVRIFHYWLERCPENKQEFTIYIQMQLVGEYFEGQNTLAQHSTNVVEQITDKKSKRKEVYRIFKEIEDGLLYTHQQGIVHRDLQPANILVDYDGTIKIADYGLAKDIMIETESLNFQIDQCVSVTPGANNYRAKEAQSEYDFDSDIYALGAILFDLLHGLSPELQKQIFEKQKHNKIHYRKEDKFQPEFELLYPIQCKIIAIMMAFDKEIRSGYKSLIAEWENDLFQ